MIDCGHRGTGASTYDLDFSAQQLYVMNSHVFLDGMNAMREKEGVGRRRSERGRQRGREREESQIVIFTCRN